MVEVWEIEDIEKQVREQNNNPYKEMWEELKKCIEIWNEQDKKDVDRTEKEGLRYINHWYRGMVFKNELILKKMRELEKD